MAYLHACVGCIAQGQPCEPRDNLRAKIKGLGVTSIKWKCSARVARFKVGDPVWARVGVTTDPGGDMDLDYEVDDFPGTVVRAIGSKALVFIKPGAESQCGDPFVPKGNGFCKLPLSRLTTREGQPETICRSCEQPESVGHIEGYRCFIDARLATPISLDTARTEEA